MYELIYTSTPQGLITGRSGFTTVALTEGFPSNLIAPVENMSGYKPLFLPGDAHEDRNPVNFSCQHFQLGRTPYIVLSRISYAGLSYTGRSNVLAHHLLFAPGELDGIPGGAVSVLRAAGNFPAWSGSPRMLPQRRTIDHLPLPSGGEMWQKWTGDARWGQYTAERFRAAPDGSFALAFDPLRIDSADLLTLIAETASYLTPEELRRFTFCTYSYASQVGNPLFFRAYVGQSAQLGSIRRLDPESVISLGEAMPVPAWWQASASLPAGGAEDAAIPAPADAPVLVPEEEPEEFYILHSGDSAEPFLRKKVEECDLKPSQPPPVPAENPAPVTQEQIVYAPVPEESDPPASKGKYVVRGAIALVILGLCVLIFLRIFMAHSPEEHGNGLEPGSLADLSTPSSETVPERRPARIQPPEPPRQEIPVKVRSAEAPDRPAKEGSGFAPLSHQEIFELYCSFYSGRQYILPEGLKAAEALELTIHAIGGMQDNVSELSRFIAGNNSRVVTLYPRKAVNTSFVVEWDPDMQNPAGRMTVGLSENGVLTYSLPGAATDVVPRLSDISRVTFLSRNGLRCSFAVNELPACMDGILVRELAPQVKSGDGAVQFLLKVPDHLWLFRHFYTIQVNRTDLGGITQREILLHKVELHTLFQDILERNRSLDLLLALEKKERNFLKTHQSALIRPSLRENKQVQPHLAQHINALQKAGMEEPEEAWLKAFEAAENHLKQLQDKGAITPVVQSSAVNALKTFRTSCQTHNRQTKALAEIRQDSGMQYQDYNRKNKLLQEKLEFLSPALSRAARPALTQKKVLDSDFYRKIGTAQLLKDVQIKITRKVQP